MTRTAFQGEQDEIAQLREDLARTRQEIAEVQAELSSRRAEIYAFENRVEARLGRLTVQIADLETEIAGYLKRIEQARNKRVFGQDHPFDDPDYWRNQEAAQTQEPTQQIGFERPDEETLIRSLYRQLARVYHPDLAEDEADRAYRTRKMAEINQAYQASRVAELKAQAIFAKIPTTPTVAPKPRKAPQTEQERLVEELQDCRREIARNRQELQNLHNHPSVQLSLDVKIALHEGRDLLGEMARGLKIKIARKIAERDFLKSQLESLDP